MRSSAARGFTLIEVMIVVAMIAVLSAIVSHNASQTKQRTSMRKEALELRAAIEGVRTLAAQAGSKLGTPRLQLGPTCLNAPSGDSANLWIVFDPPPAQRARVPVRLRPAVADLTVVDCETIELGLNDVEYRALLPAPPPAFTFTSTGRLLGDGAPIPPTGIHVMLTHPTEPTRQGFRLLTSGVVCDSSDPAPGPGAPLCDEDA